MQISEIIDSLDWSDGPGTRTAEPTGDFWRHWSERKSDLKASGISPIKLDSGRWLIRWFDGRASAKPVVQKSEIAAPLKPSKGFVVPAPKDCTYFPFQLAGIEFCSKRRAAYIGDVPGLGKTVQSVGVANLDSSIKKILILTKASLKTNWYRELKKWLVRPLSVGICSGGDWPKTDVVVANYDIIHRHYDALRRFEWDLVVLDEAQAIKSRNARRTQHVIGKKISKRKKMKGAKELLPIPARRKICLSGTPIENRPEEIWTALNYLEPEKWPSFYPFAKAFCDMKQSPWGLDTTGASNLDELRSRLSGLMIRRQKHEVLPDLPPKTRVVIELEFDGSAKVAKAERSILGEMLNADFSAEDDETEEQAFFRVVQGLRGMKKGGMDFSILSKIRHETALAKIPAMIEALQDDAEECRKALVFFHHRDVGQQLQKAFSNSVLIGGETPVDERQALCDKFQNDPKCRWFFGSIRACGEGLNLTAADLVAFAEQDWSPAKMSQCEDRACRIGQKNNVLVKHYVVPGTIDANMIRRTVEKQQVIDQVLSK